MCYIVTTFYPHPRIRNNKTYKCPNSKIKAKNMFLG